MTPKQRDLLRHRFERALLWSTTSESARLEATRLANRILDEIERTSSSAGLGQRAVSAVIRRVEEAA